MTSKIRKEENEINDFAICVADDLNLLSAVQRTELTKDTIRQLQELVFPLNLNFVLKDKQVTRYVGDTLNEINQNLNKETLDELAVDFANIYLVHTYQASPYESVWLDEESLMQQQPMFDIKKEYDKHNLQFDEQERYADHICLQLDFIAFLMNKAQTNEALNDVGVFMDNHILRWVKLFSGRVAKHALTEFYASFVILTTIYLEELRDLIEEITGIQRVNPELEKKQVFEDIPMKFIPGVAKSW